VRRCAQCQVDYPDALEFCPNDGNRLPPLPGDTKALYDPLIGSTIDGRYIVDSVLGEGGMGMVYAGRHAIIDKRVAIKVLRKEAAAEQTSAQRFLAEAKAASKIGQQNIVDITDFGVLPDGHAYFVMEFLDGPTLGKVVSKGGPIAPARAAQIAMQVCKGLHAAHQKGIVHRDLKPENIFVLSREAAGDFVKIVDFGIARDTTATKRLTVAGMVMGTPEYMAPEQASGQETDHRVDQYALGCIMYEMLTGHTPFRGENPMQTLTKHVFDAVPLPSKARPDLVIPAKLEAIIMRTLAKKRDERYADLNQLMEALAAEEPRLREIMVPLAAQRRQDPAAKDPAAKPAPATARPAGDSIISGELAVARRRPTVFFAVAGAAVAVLAVVAVALRSSSSAGGASSGGLRSAPGVVASPSPPSPQATTTAGELPAPKVDTPKPDKPDPAAESVEESKRVELSLTSVPAGADVYCKDELIGTTPFKVTRAIQPGEQTLVFRKAGFKDATRAVQGNKDAYLDVALLRDPTSSKHGPSPANPGGKPSAGKPAGAQAKPAVTKPLPGPDRPRSSELRNPFDDPPSR
jgi:serine/threonine-protein kinase